VSTARIAGIPVDHVVAEMAAFPLTSPAALELGLAEFDPLLGGDTQRLWRAAEGHMLGAFPSFSVDEAVTIRDAIWFANQVYRPVSMAEYLRLLAGWFLEPRGPVAVPRLPSEVVGGGDGQPSRDAAARRLWRWLSFALPPDLLLAALAPSAASPQGPGGIGEAALMTAPGEVETVSPVLARILEDRGYAETHCHIGAALDFSELWVSCLTALARPDMTVDRFFSPGAALDEGRDLAPWLVRAASARYALAAYLDWGRDASSFDKFLNQRARGRLARWPHPHLLDHLVKVLGDLMRGRLVGAELSFGECRALYAQLTGLTGVPFPTRRRQIPFGDPISGLLPPIGNGRVSSEVRLVAAALSYQETAPDDRLFAAVFWQVVRIRTLFYRHVVQRPLTPGLQWFIRFFGRIGPGRRPISPELLFECAAHAGGAGRGLRSLEVRTSPETEVWRMVAYAEAVRSAARRCLPADRRRRCEYGLVLHFTKDRGGGAREGRPIPHGRGSHADPASPPAPGRRANPTGYRYAAFYEGRRPEALAFGDTLRSYPLTLQILRGIDVCTDELGVPTWVFVPLIDYVRRAAAVGSSALRQVYGLAVPPPRMTVHVGEDFVHLLSGLRRVDEAVEHLRLGEGDRIGHGVALGADPRDWARRAGRIPLTREERLFDLVWEWNWYAREGGDPPAGRLHALDYEIAHLARQVFWHDLPAPRHTLWTLAADLHDPEALRRVRFPGGPASAAGLRGRDAVLRDYLTLAQVFTAGREIVWVDPAAEAEVLAGLQAGLRRKVADRGITVEVNPTSNLLIGDLHDLARHPLWRLRPPRPDPEFPPVHVCLGSDDPVTFATHLRQEYQLIHDALVLAGLTEAGARRWLDRARSAGMETRFTLPRVRGGSLWSFLNLDGPDLDLPP
jgi:hypothetical protein